MKPKRIMQLDSYEVDEFDSFELNYFLNADWHWFYCIDNAALAFIKRLKY